MVGFDGQGFKADELLKVIAQLDLSQFVGCIYGSGFEAQPGLLQKIADAVLLLGNTANTVRAIKHATQFFSALRQLNIVHPAVFDVLPVNDEKNRPATYLKKFAAGSGGTHIRLASANDAKLLENEYYQQQLSGHSVSLLFLADGHKIEVVGFNEQWLSPCDAMPFRYGGAVSHVVLPNSVQQQLIEAAEKLTVRFGLLGLNSLDAIVRDDKVYVLEVNPRLSATVDLYDHTATNLIDRHVQVCLNRASLNQENNLEDNDQIQQSQARQSRAHAIVYATFDIEIAPSTEWPGWVMDTPFNLSETKKILAGNPICTVTAYDDGAEATKQLLYARVEIVQNLLEIYRSPYKDKLTIAEEV